MNSQAEQNRTEQERNEIEQEYDEDTPQLIQKQALNSAGVNFGVRGNYYHYW